MSRRFVVVIPAFNEEGSLEALLSRLLTVNGCQAVVVVNDGSTDGTVRLLTSIGEKNPSLSILNLRVNSGKAVALKLGFEEALRHGAGTVVMMDADGQDEPAEIHRLIELIELGEADLVTGARTQRKDAASKKFVSRIYNKATASITGTPSKDLNSGLKTMKAEVAKELIPFMYGEMHRYITVIAHWRGFRVKDVDVVHHPRLAGESKYNSNRFWRGFVDLLTIRFLLGYGARPNHLFAGMGLMLLALGGGLLTWMAAVWLSGDSIGNRPALLAGVLFSIAGIQVLTIGLLAELMVFSRQKESSKRSTT